MIDPRTLDPDTVLERLSASGLRGRGGGWFPTARKWRAVRVEGGEPVAIANGAEGEPGSLKDRYLMLTRPGAILSGLVLAARAIGAREAFVFLKASFDGPAEALQLALEATDLAGVEVRVRRGDDGYITGEETALLEALEGRRPWPRPKPPLPAAVGLEGRPTLVQNVETLARVGPAVADPVAYHRDETTLVTVWGDVARPGVREARLGTPLRRVVEEAGPLEEIGLVFPGGPAGPPLCGTELEAPLDPDALRAAGTSLGTASVLVVGASACPLAVAASLAGFYERESCGQCPPCTVGTASLARILRGLEQGGGRARDLRDLREVAGFMSGHGHCAHCRAGAQATTGLVDRLRAAVDAHLAGERGCPWPERRHPDPFAPRSPERTALESAVEAQLR